MINDYVNMLAKKYGVPKIDVLSDLMTAEVIIHRREMLRTGVFDLSKSYFALATAYVSESYKRTK